MPSGFGQRIEVRNIASGIVLYRGLSLREAARRLVPGTCYGRGLTALEANRQAEEAVRRFRAGKSLTRPGSMVD